MANSGTQDQQPLPDGWIWTAIGEVCAVNPGMVRPEHLPDGTPVSFVPMAAVDDIKGAITAPQPRAIGEVWRGYTRFAEDDVIFAKITPCMENGKAAVAKNLVNGIGLGSTEFHVLRCQDGVLPQWVYHFVRQSSFRKDAAARMTGTAGQLRVPAAFMREAQIPLAPLPEQHRIVEAIETQFTRLDAAVAALQHARTTLQRYKASVLKAACEGRLVPTEAELARAEGCAYEPADVLLQRILAERRARWEASDPGKPYREPAPPDTSDLPKLSEGWVWVAVEQIGDVRLGRQRSPEHHQGPYMRPYLRAANATWSGVDLSDVKEMNFPPKIAGNYRLQKGDILLAEASGSQNEVGKPFTWNEQILDCCFQNTLIRVRLWNLPPGFVHLHFLRDALSGRFGRVAKGIGIHHLGADRLSVFPIAFPPLAEQHRIVEEVDRRLSVVAALQDAIEANLARAGRLRQSILKRAFEGRLVPQDPNDEPASVLLERIRAKRGEARAERGADRTTRDSARKKQTPQQLTLL